MQKWILAIALALNFPAANAQSYEERVQDYISRFKDLAIQEQKRSGIPASITLAQGIHETSAGNSELAINANNHFGIKCKKEWGGMTYSYTDDAPNECFRKYDSPQQSYIDHSDYLSRSPRYASLFKCSPTDYASWATGLRKCGYATNPRYAQILIKLIEDYKLQEFTYIAMNNSAGSDVAIQDRQNEIVPEDDPQPAHATATIAAPVAAATIATATPMPAGKRKSNIVVNENTTEEPATAEGEKTGYPPYGEVVRVNGLKAVYARKGDMPLEYALKTDVRYEKLLEINDISDRPLPEDMYLYLERRLLKGLRPTHMVKEGESIAQVARYEGMNVKSLRNLNHLREGEEPAAGSVLYLQGDAPAKPQVTAAKQAPTVPVDEITTTQAPEPASPAVAISETIAPVNDNTAPVQPVEEQPAENTPVEENTLAGNTAAEPATVITEPITDQQAAATTELIEKTDIGPAVPTGAIPPVAETVATTEPGLPNPPATVNIANEKPIEEVLADEKKTQPEPPKEEEPKDELDALKARFDKVVYAKRNTSTTEPAPTEAVQAGEQEVKTEPTQQPAATASTGGKYYTVKKGDTAFSIAKRNNITMRQLMEWNNLNFEAIKVGQKLKVQL